MRLRAEVDEVGFGGRRLVVAGSAVLVPDADDAIRLGERERGEEHRADDAEHRRVRADPQRERQQRDKGEARSAAQRTHGVAKILSHLIDECHAESLPGAQRIFAAAVVACVFEIAESPAGFGRRVGRRPSVTDELRGDGDEVELELLIDVPQRARPSEGWKVEQPPCHAGSSTLNSAAT